MGDSSCGLFISGFNQNCWHSYLFSGFLYIGLVPRKKKRRPTRVRVLFILFSIFFPAVSCFPGLFYFLNFIYFVFNIFSCLFLLLSHFAFFHFSHSHTVSNAVCIFRVHRREFPQKKFFVRIIPRKVLPVYFTYSHPDIAFDVFLETVPPHLYIVTFCGSYLAFSTL